MSVKEHITNITNYVASVNQALLLCQITVLGGGVSGGLPLAFMFTDASPHVCL